MAQLVWTFNGVKQTIEFADIDVAKSAYQDLRMVCPCTLFTQNAKQSGKFTDGILSDDEMDRLAAKIANMVRVG